MLRNDCLTALNEVLVCCRESVDRYRNDAALLSEEVWQQRFASWARQRAVYCEHISDGIRRLGSLPDTPDVERETLSATATWLKSHLSSEGEVTVFTDCEAAEHLLAQKIAAALRAHPPEDLQALLEDLGQQVENTRVTLLSAASRPDPDTTPD